MIFKYNAVPVGSDRINKILSEVEIPVEDPRFYDALFGLLSRDEEKGLAKSGDPILQAIKEPYDLLSRNLEESQIQEGCSVRNILKTRKLAEIILNDEGEINADAIKQTIVRIRENHYSLGPDKEFDAKRDAHILKVLTLLSESKPLQRRLKLISKPALHPIADEIIRQTLQLPPKTVVTNGHARRAALAAWLTYLRQNVGSCFATAPAIVVHEEQPELFLRDIQELLSTGRLKRTFGGVEYAVPLSYTWGAGDLRRVFLFQKSGYMEEQPIWKSPGLVAAFEHAGIVGPALSLEEKFMASKRLIANALMEWPTVKEWFTATMEEVLRRVMLKHLGLTEADIREYEQRPKGMFVSSIMFAPTASSKELGGIGQKCAQFLSLFDEAKNAFKALADNALLKSWEFTIASFSESKAQFTTWNLYASLGLRPNDKGGIGPCLYQILKRKLDECNDKVKEFQADYEQAFAHLQYLQNRIRRAGDEKEARWIRMEYQSKSNEFATLEELRDKFHFKAHRYANLYDGFVDLYFRLFPNYFQEIYDADILEVAPGPFDDSPAGFRLLYKHGRTNTAQWTQIRNPVDFIDSLANFFTVTENELMNSREMKGLEEDISEIVTAIVSHVRSEEFLETAFHRMAAAHNAPLIKDPLQHLDKIQKKPWVYTSGGAMNTLVTCYFCLEGKPKESECWVENPDELLVFLIDTVKEIPHTILGAFEDDPEKSLLIHSPTHAFTLKPGYPRFVEGWKNKQFTYTWVRDTIVQPMRAFSSKLYLDAERMQFVLDALAKLVPHNYRPYFKQTFVGLGGSMKASDLRQYILDTIDLTLGLHVAGRSVLSADQIDSTLHALLPLFPSYKLKERVETILSQLPGLQEETRRAMGTLLEDITGRVGAPTTISAKGLQNIVKALLALFLDSTMASENYPLLVSQIAQKEGFAMPEPFIIADTNWVKDHFAFLVNPGNEKFELWRIDYTGSVGVPMSDWNPWMNGSRKQPTWGVYIQPHEYTLRV